MSLAYIYPDKAEKYAIDFWHRDKYKDNDYDKAPTLKELRNILGMN